MAGLWPADCVRAREEVEARHYWLSACILLSLKPQRGEARRRSARTSATVVAAHEPRGASAT